MKVSMVKPGIVNVTAALALTLAVACSAAVPDLPPSEAERDDVTGPPPAEEPSPARVEEAPPDPAESGADDTEVVTAPDMAAPETGTPLSAPPPSDVGKAIVVDQTLQIMGVFEDGVEIRRMPISTGRPTYTTYTLPWNGYVGDYWGTIQADTGGRADNAWFLYRASGAILIHGVPYHEVNGVKQYYDLEAIGRYPSSAGCIRLLPDDAEWFTEWGPLNAAIRITEWPGEIAGLIGDPLPYP